MTDKQQNQYFSKWYEGNSEEHNKARRAKYKADSDYAESVRARNRAYRKRKREEAGGKIYRDFNGIQVEVFKISDAANMADLDPSTIRSWELSGRIPKPSFAGVHRVYTAKQVGLLAKLKATTQHQERALLLAEIIVEWDK